MDSDRYSLSNLRDIVVPDPPPAWPPAPGVWVLMGVAAVVVLAACWCIFAYRRRNAHRRAGLALLDGAGTAYDISMTLKRVALAVFPREQVASLHGEDWVAFLNGTCSRCRFPETSLADSSAEASRELVELAGIWIRHHRFPESGTSRSET